MPIIIVTMFISSVINPSLPDPGRREKINLNFYVSTSLWYLKRFYEDLKGLHKTFWGTTKKCENKNSSLFSVQLSEMQGAGRVNKIFRHRIFIALFRIGHKRYWLMIHGNTPARYTNNPVGVYIVAIFITKFYHTQYLLKVASYLCLH